MGAISEQVMDDAKIVSEEAVWEALTDECERCDGLGYRPTGAWGNVQGQLEAVRDNGDAQLRSGLFGISGEEGPPAYERCIGCRGLGRRLTDYGFQFAKVLLVQMEIHEQFDWTGLTP